MIVIDRLDMWFSTVARLTALSVKISALYSHIIGPQDIMKAHTKSKIEKMLRPLVFVSIPMPKPNIPTVSKAPPTTISDFRSNLLMIQMEGMVNKKLGTIITRPIKHTSPRLFRMV